MSFLCCAMQMWLNRTVGASSRGGSVWHLSSSDRRTLIPAPGSSEDKHRNDSATNHDFQTIFIAFHTYNPCLRSRK